jgi:ADP-heptose:LPS heptosyltransferase
MRDRRKARILVLKGAGLSQFVEAEPSFAAIRESHPDASIDLLTNQAYGRLAKGAPYFDRVLAAGIFKDKQSRKNFLSQLKKQNYAMVYDLDGTQDSQEIRKTLTGWRGAEWIGPKRVMNNGRSRHDLMPSFAGPAMRKMLAEANLAVEERLPDLSWALKGRKDAANMRPSWYGISGDYALLLPARDELKRWPAEYYAEVAGEMVRRGVTPVLVGNSDMKTFGNTVTQLMVQIGPKGGARALVDLTDKTDLAQLAALARDARFFLSGTTEEVYLTLSLGCPGVLLMNPAEQYAADALYGRDIVRITAESMTDIEPTTALNMLVSMGLLPREAENAAALEKEADFA